MKTTAQVIALSITFSLMAFAIHRPEYLWLVINGYKASEHANGFLEDNIQPTPDWAYDLVIYQIGDTVTFSEHNSGMSYVYSKNKHPSSDRSVYFHAFGPWYIRYLKHNK